MGIPIVSLGVAIGALVGKGAVSVPVSPLGEDWLLQPWADRQCLPVSCLARTHWLVIRLEPTSNEKCNGID